MGTDKERSASGLKRITLGLSVGLNGTPTPDASLIKRPIVRHSRACARSAEMRAVPHMAIAGVSAFGTVAVLKHQYPAARLPDPAFAGIVAALASGLPDLLEPATSPHHRQFCHSAAFAALVIAGMKKLYEWQPKTPGDALLRDVLLSIGFGYLAHLGADATTAMGLPLLGKLA